MSKERKTFDLEERLVDFSVRIIRIVESKLHNSKFLVRYSLFYFTKLTAQVSAYGAEGRASRLLSMEDRGKKGRG